MLNYIIILNDVLDKFKGKKFQINEQGQIVIETIKEGKDFLRLLNDYYKQGLTTQKYYATDGGSIVKPAD